MSTRTTQLAALAALLVAGLATPSFAEDSKDQNGFFPQPEASSPVVIEPVSSETKPKTVFEQAFDASTERQ